MDKTPTTDPPTGRCSRCGRPDASRIGDRWLCEDCYAAGGSCCPEFGPQEEAEE